MDKLNQIIESVLNIKSKTLLEDTCIFNNEGWDSLSHMNLIVAIEEEFNIELTMEEIMVMNTLTKIKEVISNKLNK